MLLPVAKFPDSKKGQYHYEYIRIYHIRIYMYIDYMKEIIIILQTITYTYTDVLSFDLVYITSVISVH